MKASLKRHFITAENLNDTLFYNALAEELNNIIDEELNKNYEEINAELIDDCCLALSAICELQNNGPENSENVKSINSIIKKYNLQNRKKLVVAAACAAVAVFTVGTTISTVGNMTMVGEGGIIKTAVGKIEEIFKRKEPTTEPTTELTTEEIVVSEPQLQTSQQFTEPPLTTETAKTIKNITVFAPSGFYGTVASREDISLNNFSICVNYTTGEKAVVPISDATYEICETKEDGFTEIKIYYKGFTTSYYVTVIPEKELNPVIVTSLYGTFENSYTIDDMRIFAVLSDGTEKEINKNECTITTEDFSDGDETGVIVTVEYENCSFQFLSE